MGTEYTVYLFDELDWRYKNYQKEDTIRQMKEVYPSCEVIVNFNHCLIFDIGKNFPSDCVGKVTADVIMFTDDIGQFTPINVKASAFGR